MNIETRIKQILVVLLILVSITQIFTIPGFPLLESFYRYILATSHNTPLYLILFKFTPLNLVLLNFLFENVGLITKYASFRDNVWVFYKLILFICYLLSFLSICFYAFKRKLKFSIWDLAIIFFGSVALTLITLSYSFLTILVVPFYLLSLYFLFEKKYFLSTLLFLLSITSNWSILIVGPFHYFYYKNQKKNFSPINYFFLIHCILPLVFTIIYWMIIGNKNFLTFTSQHIGSMGYFRNLFHIFPIKPSQSTLVYLLAYLFLLFRFKKLASIKELLCSLFVIYSLFVLVTPYVFIGNLIIPIVIAILWYLEQKDRFTLFNLFITNILVFLTLFIFFGNAGKTAIRGNFVILFYYVFFGLHLVYVFNIFKIITSRIKNININFFKYFAILILVLINIALIPADGTSDHVSWTQYSVASVETGNPFKAQTIVDQRYPPLNTLIMGGAAIIWNKIIGSSPDYAIATKISILIFYILTLLTFIKITNKSLKKINILLVYLSTFSLFIQTQGLADVNIYLIPSLFISIYLLFKKKYLLSGLLFGITLSIKWQPIILLPVFFVSLFGLYDKITTSLKQLAIFLFGFAIVPLLSWILVYIQPGGREAIIRSTDYLIQGAPMLSGQALNINWVVTYFMHLNNPQAFESMEQLEYLNRQLPTVYAPFIFQGLLFYIAAAGILIKYWIIKQKTILSFSAASLMIFFSHHILNKSAYEKHLIYTVIFMLFIYILRPSRLNRMLLLLFDIMTVMNLIFFYGFTGPKDVNRLFFKFDLTLIFSLFYLIVYIIIFIYYIGNKILIKREEK